MDAEIRTIIKEARRDGMESIYRFLTVNFSRYGVEGSLELLWIASQGLNLWPRSLQEIAVTSYFLDTARFHISNVPDYLDFLMEIFQVIRPDILITSEEVSHTVRSSGPGRLPRPQTEQIDVKVKNYTLVDGPAVWRLEPQVYIWSERITHANVRMTIDTEHPESAELIRVAREQVRVYAGFGLVDTFTTVWRIESPENLLLMINRRPIQFSTQQRIYIKDWKPTSRRDWCQELAELGISCLQYRSTRQEDRQNRATLSYQGFEFPCEFDSLNNLLTILWSSEFEGIIIKSGAESSISVWRSLAFFSSVKQWIKELKDAKLEVANRPIVRGYTRSLTNSEDTECLVNLNSRQGKRLFSYVVQFRNHYFQGVLPYLIPQTNKSLYKKKEPETFGPFRSTEHILHFLSEFQVIIKSKRKKLILTYDQLMHSVKNLFNQKNIVNIEVKIDTHDPEYPYLKVYGSDLYRDYAIWIGKKRKRVKQGLGWVVVPTYKVDLEYPDGDFVRLAFAKTPEDVIALILQHQESEEAALRTTSSAGEADDTSTASRKNPRKKKSQISKRMLLELQEEYKKIRAEALPVDNASFNKSVKKLLWFHRVKHTVPFKLGKIYLQGRTSNFSGL